MAMVVAVVMVMVVMTGTSDTRFQGHVATTIQCH